MEDARSFFGLADVSVRSPRKLLIVSIKINVDWIKVCYTNKLKKKRIGTALNKTC